MAAIPKSIKLTGITIITTIGTVPADKVWLIKSMRVAQAGSSTDVPILSIGGDEIGYAVFSIAKEALELVPASAGSGVENGNIIASDGEIVSIDPNGAPAKNVRMSYIEIDVP